MVHINITEAINQLKKELLSSNSLELLCYRKIHGKKFSVSDVYQTDGDVEEIASLGFLDIMAQNSDVIRVESMIKNPSLERSLTVYHYIGLALQKELHARGSGKLFINYMFTNSSLRYKYLIAKIFPDFNDTLIYLAGAQNHNERDASNIKRLLISNDDSSVVINTSDSDIVTLLILEDLSNLKSSEYTKEMEKLFESILYCAREVQSKHRVFNNNEDQINSVFHSILSVNFRVENQSQRGTTLTNKMYGELDVMVFTKESNYPLSILEAFVISSIDTNYIGSHLDKLTHNYDANGLTRNYSIIYAKHVNFSLFWNRYLDFVNGFQYKYELSTLGVVDVTKKFPVFTNIRIGLGLHKQEDRQVELYHIFINMIRK